MIVSSFAPSVESTPIIIGPQPHRIYPEHILARKAVHEALKAKKLTKSRYCEACGTLIDSLEGHHRDYSKPLEAKWLCKKCHRKEHKRAFDYYTYY